MDSHHLPGTGVMRQQVDTLRLTPDTRRYVWMWLIPAAMVVAGLLTQTSGLAA
jgi:hypothetical protein